VKPLLIVNPRAGGGRAGRTFASLKPVVENALGAVDVQRTESPGHGIALARAAAESGRELVVAIGGDGTLHEVANGILDAGAEAAKKTALGFVAQGTGGDFRKSLGLEHRLDHYLAAISSGRERCVDVGRATFRLPGGKSASRWFVNILSAGLGGKVDRFVADAPRALPPTAAYFWASARALASSEAARVTCVVERAGARTEHALDAWVIAVCNGTTFGSGMRVAPMAVVDDGTFELIALSAPSRLAAAVLSRKLYTAAHIGSSETTHLRGERIEIRPAAAAREPVFLDIDGEPLGELPVTIEIAAGALRMRV